MSLSQTSTQKVLAVIPARYASKRFPGKPLVDIGGKPMICHVYDRATEAGNIDKAVVATDDRRIEAVCKEHGIDVQMTSPNHPSGTDRVFEVAKALPDYDIIANIQGDEPFLNPKDLTTAIDVIKNRQQAAISTLVTPFSDEVDFQNPNMVKAVMAKSGQVLYFSRAPIPYHRNQGFDGSASAMTYRHLGLYIYRRDALERFCSLPPSDLERLECLEQLRALEDNMAIHAVVVSKAPVGIDTPEDLNRLKDYLSDEIMAR